MVCVRNNSEEESVKLETLTKGIESELTKKAPSDEAHRDKEAQLQHSEKTFVDLKKDFDSRLSEESVNISVIREELRAIDVKDLSLLQKLLKSSASSVRVTL